MFPCHRAPGRSALPSACTALALGVAIGLPTLATGAGLGVVRDAETGQLRAPTAAEAQAFEQAKAALAAPRARLAAPRAAVGGIETRYADGTVSRTLDDDQLLLSTATKDSHGTVALQCLPAEQAQRQLSARPLAGKASHDR